MEIRDSNNLIHTSVEIALQRISNIIFILADFDKRNRRNEHYLIFENLT